MENPQVVFSEDVRNETLDFFDKQVDGEGFLVEKSDPTARVLTPDGEEIRVKEWGGIRKGSEAFIKSDTISLLDLAKRMG